MGAGKSERAVTNWDHQRAGHTERQVADRRRGRYVWCIDWLGPALLSYVPVSRPSFGVSDGNDDQSMGFIAEYDTKRKSLKRVTGAASMSSWKATGVMKDDVQRVVHGGSKSNCSTGIPFRIPVKRFVKIDTGTTEILNRLCHDPSAPTQYLGFGAKVSFERFQRSEEHTSELQSH